MTKAIYLFTVIAIWLAPCAKTHSHLANPLPTRRLDCRAGNGRPRDCYGPCPPLNNYGAPTGISPSHPAEIWRRGQTRMISWHRNNHGKGESGFVRFTLVPIKKMMDKSAHARFTFQISCWDSGLHSCKSRSKHVCGNDAEGKAYKVPVVVPSAYPDGVYVFGWAWYGGGDYKGRSFFGDYYSCSFIRMQGGLPVTSSSKPVFVPGINSRFRDGCLASTNRLGRCAREPCYGGNVQKMSVRNLPSVIFQKDIGGTYQSNQAPTSQLTKPPRQRPNPKPQNPKPGRKGHPIHIKGMQIVDVRTRRMRLVKGGVVKVKTSKYSDGFTLALQVTGNVEKVHFDMPGFSQTELLPPFIVNGNSGGSYSPLACRRGTNFIVLCTIYAHGNTQKKATYNVRCI